MDTTSPMAPCFENGLSIPLPVISPWLTTILNEKVTYDMPKMMDLASTAMNELLRTEATRASGTVISNSLALVETLTDKQHGEGIWAVVDVSIDTISEGSQQCEIGSCRRLPSGCIIQD
ncbi:hypothetical protein FXO38_27354 [Capsicum annuum]|nr:hypothetical protein FXO38_27354 [Capsicum annuum]